MRWLSFGVFEFRLVDATKGNYVQANVVQA